MAASADRSANWQRWGPYLSERQWGTVREDYSADGDCWRYFPHDQARSRAYRWGEDGLLGLTDRQCRLCFAVALWNGRDPILKERLFGVDGHQGNHGEDVKEVYHYLEATPTSSYLRALYKYPQAAFPYEELVRENQRRGLNEPEYELLDTGVFAEDRYVDVELVACKSKPNDLLIELHLTNHGPQSVPLHVLPTLWFRNTWSWGCQHRGGGEKPYLRQLGDGVVEAVHETLGTWRLHADAGPDGELPELLFTENETNQERLFQAENQTPYVKDAFHRYVIEDQRHAINPDREGTKCAAHYVLDLAPGESVWLRLRLGDVEELPEAPFASAYSRVMRRRREECQAYLDELLPEGIGDAERQLACQAYAGLFWTKQFYHVIIRDWLSGDPEQPAPPPGRENGRNRDWQHLYNHDVISMPDKWEYPWYAAWDLAFHLLPMVKADPHFAKQQLLLFLREWYMHPNGQLPAYEFAFGDVNPPVHAWACWRVYQLTAGDEPDITFLARSFQKLLLNFTWWVNRKDANGDHLFSGGFLGLDNIGLFDRSDELPGGGRLEQADGTAWMAFYCATMLRMALELATHDPAYEDVATKFFEHFIAIVDAMHSIGDGGLWDEQDGFYYDVYKRHGEEIPLRVRSMVGLIPLCAVEILDRETIDQLPGFRKRLNWFLENRQDLARHITYCQGGICDGHMRYLLAVPSPERLRRVLERLLDEDEFLSPHGIRSLSRYHAEHPYDLSLDGEHFDIAYSPGESTTHMFGGNSNWRGPVWLPVNWLLIEALETYDAFFGEEFQVECPTGSGQLLTLKEVAEELSRRLASLFLPGEGGKRPCFGTDSPYHARPSWQNLMLFHEYFHGDTGKGLGASHQTGWTALVINCLERLH